MIKEELKKYGKSEEGNFQVVDTIGVPHPYCITPKHVAVASDKFGGMLGKEAIIRAEEDGAKCDICRGLNKKNGTQVLAYNEHKQALLVSCKKEIGMNNVPNEELHKYLLSIKDMAEKDGYEGFAFEQEV